MASSIDNIDVLRTALLLIWIDIAQKYGVDYKLEIDGDTPIALPVDEYKARLKQFGSAELGVQAEFWYEKARSEFYKRINNKRILNDAIRRAEKLTA